MVQGLKREKPKVNAKYSPQHTFHIYKNTREKQALELDADQSDKNNINHCIPERGIEPRSPAYATVVRPLIGFLFVLL